MRSSWLGRGRRRGGRIGRGVDASRQLARQMQWLEEIARGMLVGRTMSVESIDYIPVVYQSAFRGLVVLQCGLDAL